MNACSSATDHRGRTALGNREAELKPAQLTSAFKNRSESRNKRQSALPPTLPPLGLSREESAAYIGVGATKFDEMVRDGRMPPAKRIDGRRVWGRPQLDRAFDALPDAHADPAHSDDEWGDLEA